MIKKEESLQMSVCRYLKVQYPSAIFHCDLAAGLKLTMGQAVRAKKMRSGRGFPDMFIAEPRGGYHGLFIELKREGTKIYLKDGFTLVADVHVREQDAVHKQLERLGYKAGFGVGFDVCKEIIDSYFKMARETKITDTINQPQWQQSGEISSN